jgi:hypothetical protein
MQLTLLTEPVSQKSGNRVHHRPILEALDAAHILPRADLACYRSRRPKTELRHDVAGSGLA